MRNMTVNAINTPNAQNVSRALPLRYIKKKNIYESNLLNAQNPYYISLFNAQYLFNAQVAILCQPEFKEIAVTAHYLQVF